MGYLHIMLRMYVTNESNFYGLFNNFILEQSLINFECYTIKYLKVY